LLAKVREVLDEDRQGASENGLRPHPKRSLHRDAAPQGAEDTSRSAPVAGRRSRST
jgi:hypothetical protein